MEVAVTSRASAEARSSATSSTIRSKVGEARRAAQTLANFEFDARDRRQGGDRGHRARQQPAAPRGRRRAADPDAGRRQTRRRRAAGHRSRPRHGQHRALPDATAIPRPAHRAPASARCAGWRPSSTSIRRRAKARSSWRASGRHRHATTARSVSRSKAKSNAAMPGA